MSTTNSETETTPSESNRTGGVSFSNDVEQQQEQSTITKKSSTELRAAKERQSLSASAKAWDLDGDGELDDAELALRNMDKSHKGTLNKEQMYALMSENLKTQRELFKVKKVVIGLVVFTCILALSNLGTSFAAAFLAKDTTTSNGELVDAKSGEAIATQSTVEEYIIDPEFNKEFNQRRRHLCASSSLGGGVKQYICDTNDLTALTADVGEKIAENCHKGHVVKLAKTFTHGVVSHDLCPGTVSYPPESEWVGSGGNKKPLEVTVLSPTYADIQRVDSTAYTVTNTLKSAVGQACDEDGDCVTGAVCDDTVGSPTEGHCLAQFNQECIVGYCTENLSCFTRQDATKVCLCANHNACPAVNNESGVCAVNNCGIAGSTPTCTTDTLAVSNGVCFQAGEVCTGDDNLPSSYSCVVSILPEPAPITEECDGC